MQFTGTLFLFLFLPLALLIYGIARDGAKEYVLFGLSMIFYAAGCLDYFLLFIVLSFAVVIIGRTMASCRNTAARRVLLILGIVLNVSALGYYKYSGFAVRTMNSLLGRAAAVPEIALPLGISFFTFKAISYLADIYTGKAELDENPLHDALYLSFFAQIQAGPLTRYQSMKSVSAGGERRALFNDGVFRFMIGFNKKVLIADTLALVTNEVFSAPFSDFSSLYGWLGSICYSLQLFFDFAGYSDMAIGLSEMFGYRCMENFNFPYMTESVSRFWRRWHISLSQWFRDYIYIPMGGSRVKGMRVYFNLFAVWLLTGIWHGANWNFIVWGLGYFVLISFERAAGIPDRFRSKPAKVIYRIFTLLFINCEWVLFRAEDLKSGAAFLKQMFVFHTDPLKDARAAFLFKDNFFIIAAALLLCFPVVRVIDEKLKERKKLRQIYELTVGILTCLFFAAALSFVVSGQNNPFAYANF